MLAPRLDPQAAAIPYSAAPDAAWSSKVAVCIQHGCGPDRAAEGSQGEV